MGSRIRILHGQIVALILLLLLAGCTSATLEKDRPAPEAAFAEAPATEGLLAEMALAIMNEHGEEYSGFHLLDSSFDGLYWRLALIDSATTSLDIQTYLWYPDASGRLLLERAILAAERGVKVRLMVDDLILHGHDQMLANLNSMPNIELRLFNPWENRSTLGDRLGEMLARMERLNTRMHDKLMIVDGRAAVVGGRNLGDHYFGLNETYNFHDTDLLGIGHIALQSNDMFDAFWNSEWVAPAQALSVKFDEKLAFEQRRQLQDYLRDTPLLASFPRTVTDWSAPLAALDKELRVGRSELVYDEAAEGRIEQHMGAGIFNFFDLAQRELLIQNAYVIPAQRGIDYLTEKTVEGLRVRLLTNSLASHDVPAVNSHYEPWRDDLLRAGVDLWEFRPDPGIQATIIDVPPVEAGFSGMHSKCAVADRRYTFVGSMNLDPRSGNINTEMGAIVDSPELAKDLARVIERNMSGENAWQLRLDERGKVRWHGADGVLERQPARDTMQRLMNVLMKAGPKEQY